MVAADGLAELLQEPRQGWHQLTARRDGSARLVKLRLGKGEVAGVRVLGPEQVPPLGLPWVALEVEQSDDAPIADEEFDVQNSNDPSHLRLSLIHI